jgi:hypothetical protein
MLTIRQEQLRVFSQVEVQKFEDWMVMHLKRFFPRQCAVAGDQRLRETVRHGIRRAKVHGITAKREVARFVDLMIVFGRDFDTDKRFQWASAILRTRRDSATKMRVLLQAAKARLGNR